MKKRHLLAGAALALAIPFGSAFAAGATPQGKTQAQVVGPVQLNGDGTATVTARYICQEEFTHLWVSAKQSESGRPDVALQGEGSSEDSAAWWQSHPVDFTCDGAWHTQSFLIDTSEQGKGELEHGQAWIQFCLTTPDFSGIVMDTRWAAVV
jgi:hypothetical protein